MGGAGGSKAHGGPDRLAAALVQNRFCRNGNPYALGECEGVVRDAMREEEKELLAAESEQEVVFATRDANPPHDLLQDLVAGFVTVLIVYRLEAVDIEIDERGPPAEAPTAICFWLARWTIRFARIRVRSSRLSSNSTTSAATA